MWRRDRVCVWMVFKSCYLRDHTLSSSWIGPKRHQFNTSGHCNSLSRWQKNLLIPKLCLVHHTFTRQCPDVLNWCIGWTHLSNKLVTCCPSCEGISSSSPRGWVSKVHLFLCQRESERQWERYLWFAYSTCLNSRIIFILEWEHWKLSWECVPTAPTQINASICAWYWKYPLILGVLVCTVCDFVSLSCQNWAGDYVLEQLLMLARVLVWGLVFPAISFSTTFRCNVWCSMVTLHPWFNEIGTCSLVCVMREQTRWLRKFALSLKQTCDVWRVSCLWSGW